MRGTLADNSLTLLVMHWCQFLHKLGVMSACPLQSVCRRIPGIVPVTEGYNFQTHEEWHQCVRMLLIPPPPQKKMVPFFPPLTTQLGLTYWVWGILCIQPGPGNPTRRCSWEFSSLPEQPALYLPPPTNCSCLIWYLEPTLWIRIQIFLV